MGEHMPNAHAVQFGTPNSPTCRFGQGQGAETLGFRRSYRFTSEGFTWEISQFWEFHVSSVGISCISYYICVFQPFLVRIVALQSTLQPLCLKEIWNPTFVIIHVRYVRNKSLWMNNRWQKRNILYPLLHYSCSLVFTVVGVFVAFGTRFMP